MDYYQSARLTICNREQLARRVMEGRLSASKWVRCYRDIGLGGLVDRSLALMARRAASAEAQGVFKDTTSGGERSGKVGISRTVQQILRDKNPQQTRCE